MGVQHVFVVVVCVCLFVCWPCRFVRMMFAWQCRQRARAACAGVCTVRGAAQGCILDSVLRVLTHITS